MKSILLALVSVITASQAGASVCESPSFSSITPDATEVAKAAATAKTESFKGTGYVEGKAFDRFYVAWLENTDYDKAVGQEGLKKLAEQGITLSNYWALTHPSQPNYMASVGGSYFGLNNDDFCSVPETIFSIADLLDSKNISWAEYQEHSPYTGYQGFEYKNQDTDANDYVRKHNPLIMYQNVVSQQDRLARIKNFTEFNHDLADNALPQWSFITPNMTNDGHDSTIQVAGNWAFNFFDPLLKNDYFTKKTLTIVTFDESETYEIPNRVAAFLIGDIPDELKGTTDDTFYDHYSLLSTVQNNWGLPNLGRGDCGANVFKIVADKTGYKNKEVDTSDLWNNKSSKGPLQCKSMDYPKPNLTCEGAGGPVLKQVVDAWS